MKAQPRTNQSQAAGNPGGDQGWQLSSKRETASPNIRRAFNVGLIQDTPDSSREESVRRCATISVGWQQSEPRRVTIQVLPNHGGISGHLTNATRGNRTAGQTVRLPHTEERQT